MMNGRLNKFVCSFAFIVLKSDSETRYFSIATALNNIQQ